MTDDSFLLTGADIWTADPDRPRATAIAVINGVVAAVGDDAVRQQHPELPPRDLGGATVLPGFIDVHNHHAVAGRADLFELLLPADATYEEILDVVASRAAALGPEEWILGGSWSSTLVDRLSSGDPAGDLHRAAGGRPVLLTDDSHHNRWASTTALAQGEIDATTSDPGGGRIVRDAAGRPTGLLFEAACLPVEEAAASDRRFTSEQHEASSARGIALLHGYGVTAFQDAGATTEILYALKALDDRGELHAWVVSSMLINDAIFGAGRLGLDLIPDGPRTRTNRHRPDFVKIFLDGVPPTRTGAFLEPYLPDHEHGDAHRGAVIMGQEELLDWLRIAAERGLSAKIHCTGDAAVRAALDAVEAVRAEGFDDPRYQIAHGQFIAQEDVARFAQLRVSADISPYLWVPGVIPEAIASVLPARRAAHMQANRDLLDAGALIAVGSDWPVSESPDPLEAMQGLITRQDPFRRRPGTLWPEQAITFDEALAAVTIGPAAAMGIDDVTGSLTVGKSAELLVLDGTLDPGTPDHIVDTRVAETWFAGTLVHGR